MLFGDGRGLGQYGIGLACLLLPWALWAYAVVVSVARQSGPVADQESSATTATITRRFARRRASRRPGGGRQTGTGTADWLAAPRHRAEFLTLLTGGYLLVILGLVVAVTALAGFVALAPIFIGWPVLLTLTVLAIAGSIAVSLRQGDDRAARLGRMYWRARPVLLTPARVIAGPRAVAVPLPLPGGRALVRWADRRLTGRLVTLAAAPGEPAATPERSAGAPGGRAGIRRRSGGQADAVRRLTRVVKVTSVVIGGAFLALGVWLMVLSAGH